LGPGSPVPRRSGRPEAPGAPDDVQGGDEPAPDGHGRGCSWQRRGRWRQQLLVIGESERHPWADFAARAREWVVARRGGHRRHRWHCSECGGRETRVPRVSQDLVQVQEVQMREQRAGHGCGGWASREALSGSGDGSLQSNLLRLSCSIRSAICAAGTSGRVPGAS
jgi:hypothetical protein